VEFEWDENRFRTNLEKHGIAFPQVPCIFREPGRAYLGLSWHEPDELRERGCGSIEDGRYFTVIYTVRGDVVRIISARRARRNERREYHRIPEAS